MGFTIPKKLEYNIPAQPLRQKYYEMIHGDIHFTLEERIEILQAVQEWNVFCNGLIILNLVFDYTTCNMSMLESRAAIIRATEETPVVKTFLEENKRSIVGLCHHNAPDGPDMYLLHTKLGSNSLLWRLVALHEIGHYLGLGHAEGEAIMAPYVCTYQNNLNRLDAEEFSHIYKVDPNDLVYKL